MKRTSLLGIALFGVGTYLLLELLFGSYGVFAHHMMERYLLEAEEDLAELEERRNELRQQVDLLTGDGETIRLEARDIGFIESDERIIRLEGHEPRPRHRYLPGTTPKPVPVPRDNRPLFRAIALALSLVALIVETLRHTTGDVLPRREGRGGSEWDVDVEGESFQTR
ncbi:MAG: septum formation initiator family protein [Alkalispirochaeta sp.]